MVRVKRLARGSNGNPVSLYTRDSLEMGSAVGQGS